MDTKQTVENMGNNQIKVSQTIPVMRYLQILRTQATNIQSDIDNFQKQSASTIVDLQTQLSLLVENINQVSTQFPAQ